jgi:hypothetical protein
MRWAELAGVCYRCSGRQKNGILPRSAFCLKLKEGRYHLPLSWQTVNVPSFAPNSSLTGISAVNANDVWAFGTHVFPLASVFSEHLSGGVWTIVPVPSPPGPLVDAFSCGLCAIATDRVWAVGNSSSPSAGYRPLVWRWNGSNWNIEGCPCPGNLYNALFSISGVKPQDLWAVGSYRSQNQSFTRSLILHREDAWVIVPAPQVGKGHNALYGVAVVKPNDAWAVGCVETSTGGVKAITLHWNGNTWKLVPVQLSGQLNHALYCVAAHKSDDVWAVGSSYDQQAQQQQFPLILHWNGSHWTQIAAGTNSNSMWLSGVSVSSSADALAVGVEFKGGVPHSLIQHWDGAAWSIQAHPEVVVQSNAYLAGTQSFNAVTMMPGGGPRAWAAGHFVDANGSLEPLVEFRS